MNKEDKEFSEVFSEIRSIEVEFLDGSIVSKETYDTSNVDLDSHEVAGIAEGMASRLGASDVEGVEHHVIEKDPMLIIRNDINLDEIDMEVNDYDPFNIVISGLLTKAYSINPEEVSSYIGEVTMMLDQAHGVDRFEMDVDEDG